MTLTTSTLLMIPVLPLLTLLFTYLALRLYMKVAERYDLTAPDVHKEGHPPVVNDSGNILPGILLLLFLPVVLIEWLHGRLNVPLGIFLSGFLGFTVGFIDDRFDFGLLKIPLVSIAGLPLIFLTNYSPHPSFPFIGRARFTIVYPYLILLIVAVISNGVNMIDVVNGSAIIQSLFAVVTIAFWSFLLFYLGSSPNLTYFLYSILILGILLGFLLLNKYPAKIFLGNSGSYGIGAMLAALVIISRKEFVTMITLLPMIFNAFIKLVSLKGFKTRENFPAPVEIREGVIFPNEESGSPLSLVGLRASISPVREQGVIRFFNILFMLSFLCSLVTGIFIYFAEMFPGLPLRVLSQAILETFF